MMKRITAALYQMIIMILAAITTRLFRLSQACVPPAGTHVNRLAQSIHVEPNPEERD